MSQFSISDLPLAGLKHVKRQPLADARGSFARIFCAQQLQAALWHGPVQQINHAATTTRGTVRGLHYQNPPYAEMKLVTCIRGAVWDVAVDVRADSPTFLQWYGAELSRDNGCALLIPEGFAHGFQALTDGVELLYCHSAAYAPAAEAGLHPLEPRLAIAWPLPVGLLSARDAAHPWITSEFEGIVL